LNQTYNSFLQSSNNEEESFNEDYYENFEDHPQNQMYEAPLQYPPNGMNQSY